MKTIWMILAAMGVSLAGCATAWIEPQQAVMMAAEAAPREVRGKFSLKVQAVGEEGRITYLNSERDYRDQRNLTIALSSHAAAQLADRMHGASLLGKDILVEGVAVRTKIHIVTDGRVTDKYYYQTHVNVTDANQILVF